MLVSLFSSFFYSYAQEVGVVLKEGGVFPFSGNQFDKDSANVLKINVKNNTSDITEFRFTKQNATLADVATDGNRINGISFLKEHNPMLLSDVVANFDRGTNTFYAVIPYLTVEELMALKIVVEATGSVYNLSMDSEAESYTLVSSGKSAVLSVSDRTDVLSAELLCADKSNNTARYHLFLRNNALPCVRIKVKEL